MTRRHRALAMILGTSVVTVACTTLLGIEDVSYGPTPDGLADATAGNDALDRPDVTGSDAQTDAAADGVADATTTRWCDGGHLFCADFDDLRDGDPPGKGWTGVSVADASVGWSSNFSVSSPNAARIDVSVNAKAYLYATLDAGGPIKTVTLTFAMRSELHSAWNRVDGAPPGLELPLLAFLSASGLTVGEAHLNWRSDGVRVVHESDGGPFYVVSPAFWTSGKDGGPLAYADWVTVSLTVNLVDGTMAAAIYDKGGTTLATYNPSSVGWLPAAGVRLDLGAPQRALDTPDLTLFLDNVTVDVTK